LHPRVSTVGREDRQGRVGVHARKASARSPELPRRLRTPAAR
jgi:hypothetical protein